MDKSYPTKTPMVVKSLDMNKDPFRPRDDDEEILGPEFPYLSAIGALMYLSNCTRPDIAFAVNLLARHSAAPTKRHWTGVKNIFRYLHGTKDLGLFYQRNQDRPLLVKGSGKVGFGKQLLCRLLLMAMSLPSAADGKESAADGKEGGRQ